MSSFERFERFAEEHPELQHNVNVGIAPPNIDHGRLLTHKRRELFSRLHAEVVSRDTEFLWEIPNEALLSPRRIHRIHREIGKGYVPQPGDPTRASVDTKIADEIFRLMQDWRDAGFYVTHHEIGYPVVVGKAGRVLGWTIRLVLS